MKLVPKELYTLDTMILVPEELYAMVLIPEELIMYLWVESILHVTCEEIIGIQVWVILYRVFTLI